MNMVKNWMIQFARCAAVGALAVAAAFLGGAGPASAADANAPERMAYQGFLADTNGAPLATNAPKNYTLVFRLFDSAASAAPLWGEQQTVTVEKGFFSVLLGEGTAVSGTPNAGIALSSLFIATNASDRYLGVTVKGLGAGGADVDILPRARLQAAPYAFLVNRAATAVALADSATGANALTSVGSQLTAAGSLSATRLTATDTLAATNLTVTGTLAANATRAGTLQVDGLLYAGGLTAGAISGTNISANTVLANAVGANNTLTVGNATTPYASVAGRGVTYGELNGMRILWGDTDYGHSHKGNGYTLTQQATGTYGLYYDTPFTTPPTVLVTVHSYGPYKADIRSVAYAYGGGGPGSTTAAVQILTSIDQGANMSSSGLFGNPGFSFVVIGK